MTMPFVCPTFYYKIPLGPIEEEDDVDDGQMSMNTSPTAEVMLQHWEHNPPTVQNLFVHFAPPIPNRRNKTAPPLFVPKSIDEEAETSVSQAEVADTVKGVAVSKSDGSVERVDPFSGPPALASPNVEDLADDDGQLSVNTSSTLAGEMLQHWEHNPPTVQNLFVHFAPPIPSRRNKTAPPLFVPKTIDEEAETTASEAEVADTDKGVSVSNVERVDPSFILRDGGEAQVIEDISQEFEEIDESEDEENASFVVSPTPPPSDAPPLAAGLHRTFDFGVLRVQWKVDATKFNKNDTLIVSPVFDVWLDNKRVPFRVQLMPSSSNFKKSDGLGHIHLSCKAEAEEAPEGNIRFSFSIGSQQARDPAENDFSKNNVGKLADTTAWDFRSAAEKGFVLVSLEVMPSEAVCA